jgi:hypothetical protein
MLFVGGTNSVKTVLGDVLEHTLTIICSLVSPVVLHVFLHNLLFTNVLRH